MKAEPAIVLRQLETKRLDPDSPAAREMVEEITERVLRNLNPRELPDLCADLLPTVQHPTD
jgi:hypothetical protein